ncbi:hypothetical protein CG747_20640 [Streptomyces sp. CB02959]|uniref:hypothetical protein n=1 Tax=Streptomyces sp. CB02959 TaxID=2020330 RepID=UPI000C277766|nr:hypothetical protein [Streptomyces sp. CB02959]PJN38956.1 hypothetical protein CG747_20640 [Streptomyces sp. CB02959]
MGINLIRPAAVADAQRRGHMAALSAAEHIVSICPQAPDTVTVTCSPWAPEKPTVRLYFHRSEDGVKALARELTTETTTRPHSDDDPAPYTFVDTIVNGVPVHAWTLGDGPADAEGAA